MSFASNGAKSQNPLNPDFVPTIFPYLSSPDKRKRINQMTRFKQTQELKRKRACNLDKRETGKEEEVVEMDKDDRQELDREDGHELDEEDGQEIDRGDEEGLRGDEEGLGGDEEGLGGDEEGLGEMKRGWGEMKRGWGEKTDMSWMEKKMDRRLTERSLDWRLAVL
ncbi:unnamed protein product [Leuciscus chuanchicus]